MRRIWGTAIIIVAVTASARAQRGKEMDASMMGDTTNMTYTGCIESVNHGGTFLLTHVADDRQMTMGHEGMKTDSSMEKKDESAGASDMHEDQMMPSALVLTWSSDLKKHVGQKVTVTGSVSKGPMDGGRRGDIDTLTIGSLKVVGTGCK